MGAPTGGGGGRRMSGPHEPRKSRYERPPTSQSLAPSPRARKNGSPPTPRKARTGLLTPPGISRHAASNRLFESRISGAPAEQRADAGSLPETTGGEEDPLVPAPARRVEVDPEELPLARAPAEPGDGVHPSADDRRHEIRRGRVRRLVAEQRLLPVRRREVGAGIDVRMIDHRDREPLPLETSDAEQVFGIDEIGRAGVPRMTQRILGMQLVLDVPAPDELARPALDQDDAARLVGILLDRLPADRVELLGRDGHDPIRPQAVEGYPHEACGR